MGYNNYELTPDQIRMQGELRKAPLGDKRLTDRLQTIGADLIASPKASIPEACKGWNKTKGTYRFFDHPMVTKESIIASHKQKVHQRCQPLQKMLCVGDTTFVTFPGHSSLSGPGEIGPEDFDGTGALIHSNIAVSPKGGQMLGVLDQQVLIRPEGEEETIRTNGEGEDERLENENMKWVRGIENSLEGVRAGVKPIFVYDRGADDFKVFNELRGREAGYVIRNNHSRAILTEEGERERLHEWINRQPVKGEIEVVAEEENEDSRREACMQVRVGTCRILPPHPERRKADAPEPIEVNIIQVKEEHPPEGEEPIHWILITDQPAGTFKQVREVIQMYEYRWVIEEWHKGIKSGTNFGDLQLEEWDRMEPALALYSIVAWRLLGLRDMAREGSEEGVQMYLTEAQREVIKKLDSKCPEDPDAEDYYLGIARIGGYLDRSNDPPPGWQILWRGFDEVRTIAIGYKLAQ